MSESGAPPVRDPLRVRLLSAGNKSGKEKSAVLLIVDSSGGSCSLTGFSEPNWEAEAFNCVCACNHGEYCFYFIMTEFGRKSVFSCKSSRFFIVRLTFQRKKCSSSSWL